MNLDAAEGFCSGGVFSFGSYVFPFGDLGLVWVRARSLGFRFLGLSAWFWLPRFLGFLVFRFLGFLATRFLTACLSCMVCWLLGFSASRLVGLSTSERFVYYMKLCYIK